MSNMILTQGDSLTFLGIPWDGTFAAALLAAAVGIATLVVSSIGTSRASKLSGDQRDREEFRLRFELAVTHALSKDKKTRLAGIEQLDKLVESDWATDIDKRQALAVANILEVRS